MSFSNELMNTPIAITVSIIGIIATIIGSYYGYKGSKNIKIAMYDKRYNIYSRTLEIFKKSISGDILQEQDLKEFINLHNQSYTIFSENVPDFIGDVLECVSVIDYMNKVLDEYLIYKGSDTNKLLKDLYININEIEKLDNSLEPEELKQLLIIKENIKKIEEDRLSKNKVDIIDLYINLIFEKLNSYHTNIIIDEIEEIKQDILGASFKDDGLFNTDMEFLTYKFEKFIAISTCSYLPKYRYVFENELSIK